MRLSDQEFLVRKSCQEDIILGEVVLLGNHIWFTQLYSEGTRYVRMNDYEIRKSGSTPSRIYNKAKFLWEGQITSRWGAVDGIIRNNAYSSYPSYFYIMGDIVHFPSVELGEEYYRK
tara:strand:- start:1366 stop:1716 length:351 start_codon:yes stop_codon:yes gene_type:complete